MRPRPAPHRCLPAPRGPQQPLRCVSSARRVSVSASQFLRPSATGRSYLSFADPVYLSPRSPRDTRTRSVPPLPQDYSKFNAFSRFYRVCVCARLSGGYLPLWNFCVLPACDVYRRALDLGWNFWKPGDSLLINTVFEFLGIFLPPLPRSLSVARAYACQARRFINFLCCEKSK